MSSPQIAPSPGVTAEPAQSRKRNASAACNLRQATHRIDVVRKAHGPEYFRFRNLRQPKAERSRVIFLFVPDSGAKALGPDRMDMPSRAIFDALFKLIDETSAAHVSARTGLPASTLSRWANARREGELPSFNADSFNALMQLDEVKSATVARLRQMPQADQAAWEGIAAKLARVMSPAVGWRLASLMTELAELEMLDSDLSAIAGIIQSRRKSSHEKSKADKLATRKGKSTG